MNYDPNITWGAHKVKVTLQQWEYKGIIIVEVGGNCKGKPILELASELYDENILESDCNFKTVDNDDFEGFVCDLKNNSGDILEVEEEWDELDNLIVGIEIIDLVRKED